MHKQRGLTVPANQFFASVILVMIQSISILAFTAAAPHRCDFHHARL
jgi:hypothetical protein